MSQVRRKTDPKKRSIILAGLLLVGLVTITACGTSAPNSKGPAFNAESGTHAAGWLPAGHMIAAQADKTMCTECHGADFSGGISGISCSQCHLGGVNSVHPEAWGQTTGIAHADYVGANGNAACANASCHGTTLSGVAGSGPSCTSCHLGGDGSYHPSGWGSLAYYWHKVYVSQNGTAGCATLTCHGPALTGGIGPSCTSCHLGGVNSIHPTEWDADITLHKNYVASKGSSSCANAVCHGVKLQGVNLSGPGCNACHQLNL